jgi:hypothetical protein
LEREQRGVGAARAVPGDVERGAAKVDVLGNFGAPPKPPLRASTRGSARARPWASASSGTTAAASAGRVTRVSAAVSSAAWVKTSSRRSVHASRMAASTSPKLAIP